MKLYWKILVALVAIIDIIGLIFIAPFGWKLADGHLPLQILVIAFYAFVIWIICQLIYIAFEQ